MYIKQTVCMYLCPSFMRQLPDQYPSNFVQTSTPTQGRLLTQIWPRQSDPWPQGIPNSKTYTDHWRKTLLYKKCLKFFLGSVRPRLASFIIFMYDYTLLLWQSKRLNCQSSILGTNLWFQVDKNIKRYQIPSMISDVK